MIRVNVYSSLPAVRAGLDRLLEGEPETVILPQQAGEAPDVAVLSGESGWRDTLAELLESRTPPVGLLLVSDQPEDCRHLASRATGGWGLLPPEATSAELRAALRAASEGLVVVHPTLLEHLTTGSTELDGEGAASLTDREREVLDLLSKGFTNPEIAGLLGISDHTVKFHTSSLYAKLGVANRTEAVRVGIRSGAIHL